MGVIRKAVRHPCPMQFNLYLPCSKCCATNTPVPHVAINVSMRLVLDAGDMRRMSMKKRRLMGAVALATILVVALFTAGCDGKTRELKESVVGIWRLEYATSDELSASLGEALGVASFMTFDNDGTFSIRMLLAGNVTEREGSWRVEDGQILVDVPEMEKPEGGEENLLDISGPAVEGMVVVPEEDGLNVDGELVTCKRISQDEYDEVIEASAGKGQELSE